jgi:hypothetical protein
MNPDRTGRRPGNWRRDHVRRFSTVGVTPGGNANRARMTGSGRGRTSAGERIESLACAALVA